MRSRTRIWQDYYDQCAELKDQIYKTARFDVEPIQYKEIIKDIARKLQLSPADFLLDIGCGNALIDARFGSRCRKILGMDFSLGELRHAQQNTRTLSNVQFVCADSSCLPLKNDSVDKILMYSVTMHYEIDHLSNILQELIRVAKPGGLILIGDNISKQRNNGLQNNGWINIFKDYCRLNPTQKSFIAVRVLTFHGFRILRRSLRGLFSPSLRLKHPVPDPFPNIAYSEDQMLKIVSQLGQKGKILQQNYELPYSRERYDLFLEVEK